MKSPRDLISHAFRQRLRKAFDGLFCDAKVVTQKIGDGSPWVIMPGLLSPGSKVLSGGGGKDISFELELAKKYHCEVAVFDPTPTGLATFAQLAAPPPGLACHPFGLSGVTGATKFALPLDLSEGSYRNSGGASPGPGITFRCLSPEDALRQAGFDSLDLLKLDIEGFEYDFIARLLEAKFRPAQIAVEFHHFLPEISLAKTIATVRLLRRAGYRMVDKERCNFLFVRRSSLAAPSRRA